MKKKPKKKNLQMMQEAEYKFVSKELILINSNDDRHSSAFIVHAPGWACNDDYRKYEIILWG